MVIKTPDIQINLDDLNHSELVALAKWCGLEASRAHTRETIYHALYHFEPIDVPDPINAFRYKMSSWLKRYWDRVKMQAPKKSCPDCFNCRDAQALECYGKNKRFIER